MVTVEVKGSKKDFKAEAVKQVNPPKYEKAEDMSNLTFLNDPSVFYNLKTRYQAELIYTYSGLFCIAVNPYKRFPIYTDRACSIYTGKRRTEVPPHLFAISDGGYQNMMTVKENQSMLITGESGAGKTENTKKVISYFAFVGATGDKPKPGEEKKSLEDQIVSTNPVLEAFGNAKTTRNDNSSRFGKFIRIHFQSSGKLSGADIENYLLEKSRVVDQASEERGYHIFYNIMSDYVPWLKEMCHLSNDIYDYKWQSKGKVTVASIDDKEDMEFAHIAFRTLMFSDEERENIYKITATTMHLANLKFKQRGREEQAEPDEEYAESGKIVAELLGVDAEWMYTNFCKPKIKVGTEIVTKGQNVEKTHDNVGALAKGLFDRLFSFLVKKCNETLETGLKRAHFIGVLDIAGFEIFDFNGFEQITINFTNEKLQQFFNHHMFVLEQEEYKKEGIQWAFVDFGMDLQATITLFEMKMGLWSILEEESMFPKATDKTFQEKLVSNHEGKSKPFLKPKGNAHFGIQHYAGIVHYNITGWLEKNKDPLNDTVIDLLKKGSNKLVVLLFADHPGQSAEPEKSGGKKKTGGFKTVCSAYRDQLGSLMTVLHATHPHFIRCIVPNNRKCPGAVESGLIMHQLTCNGVLEGIRICQIGLPNRVTYPDFMLRYKLLAADIFNTIPDKKKAVAAAFEKIGIEAEKYRVGNTKVFFRAGVLGEVEEIRDDYLGRLIGFLQAQIRGWKSRRWFKKAQGQRVNLIVVQRNLRKYLSIRTWQWYGFWQQLKPKLQVGREAKMLAELEEAAVAAEANVIIANEKNVKFGGENEILMKEKDALLEALEESKGGATQYLEKEGKLMAQKADVEGQLKDAQNRLASETEAKNALFQATKKTEAAVDSTKRDLEDMESKLQAAQLDKETKDAQLKNLGEEIAHQEELISKLNKEKKGLLESNQRTAEDHQSVEDKCNHLTKLKGKLEQNLDELEDSLEREKKLRGDMEKAKRKVEGDFKLAQEAVADLERNQKELENTLARKDSEVAGLAAKIDDEALGTARIGKQAKELLGRIDELEDEYKSEVNARAKAEKAKQALARNVEEIGDRLDEAGGATAAQVELNKKREGELTKFRRDLEEMNIQHEAVLSQLRKKHNDAIAEMSEQVDYLNKMKARSEKDKETMRREADDAKAALDALARDKAAAEKTAKQIQFNYSEMYTKLDDTNRTLNDFDATKKKLYVENQDLVRQLEESESQYGTLSKLKLSLTNQYEDSRKMADDESRDRATLLGKFRNLEHDIVTMRAKLEEEADTKADLHRQLSRANADVQMYKAKYESEGVARAEELDAARLKLQARLDEAEQQIDGLNFKNASLEKSKSRLESDLESLHIDCNRASAAAGAAEKKQKNFDKIISEWKIKVDDLALEYDNSQKEVRNYSTELFRIKACYEENLQAFDSVKRENKNLGDEVKDLLDQIGEGGRNYHEVTKTYKRLEMEKEELTAALEEAEAALEQEENKFLRGTLELSQVRQEIDRRIAEKEEEFDNTRKTHARAIESMQASLEAESKGKADAFRAKKKLESDINELEISLDHANKANSDLNKHIKKLHADYTETQNRVGEQQRTASEYREQYGIAERRANALHGELEESRTLLEQSDRARRQAESDLADGHEQVQSMSSANGLLTVAKRKLEGDLHTLHADLDEMLNEAKHSEEKAKKAMVDAARLADELRAEHEHYSSVQKQYKSLEVSYKELHLRYEESTANAAKSGKQALAKLEGRVKELEAALGDETNRYADCMKNFRKCERRIKELTFQSEEDKKNHDRMQDLVDKLQVKIKTYKKQIEEAEEIAALNLAKFRKVQQKLETVEERSSVTIVRRTIIG
ncbi:unnamed protein product [Meganyctiphanes norvegica]|uniref:Myosin motor domain-containing protein n=1 Tax=Meganyctiphanes norvegica TaxID=48144 RepID=A0AAV2QAU3_MEGNR